MKYLALIITLLFLIGTFRFIDTMIYYYKNKRNK